jgi:hypothetical protein
MYNRSSSPMKFTADNSWIWDSKILTLTEPLYLWDGYSMLTADVPTLSAGTVSICTHPQLQPV